MTVPRPKILLTYELTPEVMSRLERSFEVLRLYEAGDKEAFLASHGASVRAVVTGGHIGWLHEQAERTPNLELVAINGVGYDKVDLEQARARGFRVTNTPDLMADDVADLAIGLIIASFRQIASGNSYVRDGRWLQQEMPLGRKVTGLRFGIFGMGRIGAAIAHRLTVFGGKIAYCSRARKDVPYPYLSSLVDLARESDVLILAAAATPETRQVVNRDVLEALGPDGLLVNVARGALVDEAALVDTLRNGTLGGVALDVFENEPRVRRDLLEIDRVLMVPHIGSATRETRAAMGELLLENVEAHFAGRPLPTPVV